MLMKKYLPPKYYLNKTRPSCGLRVDSGQIRLELLLFSTYFALFLTYVWLASLCKGAWVLLRLWPVILVLEANILHAPFKNCYSSDRIM